jgi:MFS family permease
LLLIDEKSESPSLLREPSVRRLAVGYAFNSIGSAMAAVAVAYIAYRETESIVLTALVFSGNTLPFLFLVSLSSRLVTWTDIRYVLIAIDIGKMVVWSVAALLAGLGEIGYGLVVFVNFASGSLSALGAAGWPTVSERLAPPGRLPELSALFTAIPAGAAVAGALMGGFLIVLLGEAWVFALDALSYLPQIGALLLLAPIAALPRRAGGAVRNGLRSVARSSRLREAFLLAAALNLAAFPLLSMLPAMAHDIDSRGHVLGILTCAFYVGAALVVWATARLRRHFTYSRILFIGFFGAGLLLALHGAVTGWRSPGMDAVTVSLLSLLPLGLAVSLNSSLLQAIVLLACEDEDKAGVLALYGAIASVLMPLGGILLGVVADMLSPWAGAVGAGIVLTLVALALRRRLRVFDELASGVEEQQVHNSLGGHWHTHHRYLAGADIAQLTHAHLSRLSRETPTTPAVSRGSPS